MPTYNCPTCNKEFKQKCHYNEHLNKKNKCQSSGSQNTTNGTKNTINGSQNTTNGTKNTTNGTKNTINGSQNTTNGSQNTTNGSQSTTSHDIFSVQNVNLLAIPEPPNNTLPDDLTCNHCNKTFARKNALCRHIKKYCKVLNQQKIDQQEIIEKLKLLEMKNKLLEEENQKLKDEINTKQIITINNIGNTNITNNNINIAAHGQEDLSKMGDVVLMAACRRGINIVPDLISRTHFNTRLPEFHNVYIPSIKDKHVMVFDKVWELKDTNEVISNLYDTKFDYIIDNKDHFYPFLTEGEKRVFQRWEETNKNRNSDDFKEFIKDMNEKIKLLMYNKREMVIETKKRQEIKK